MFLFKFISGNKFMLWNFLTHDDLAIGNTTDIGKVPSDRKFIGASKFVG
jgi:hypothetical protein